jgi:hypothetical protein
MASPKWHVQVRGEDGLFHATSTDHPGITSAYAEYERTPGNVQLVRGDVIVLRSDQPATEPASHDALF